ncbi:MAG: 5-formyltetrahydrofolate cyclo-ligase [Bacilli bacterium]|nr:5-formyltetrahydrofolate cyclo-ligase [Bacilli bacterium]
MKDELRNKYKIIRDNIKDKDIKSNIIKNKVINTIEYQNSKVIALYKNLGSEVKTNELINYALNDNKIVVLPKVIGNTLVFYKTDNKSFTKSKYNIYEPIETDIVDNIDLFIVPGICFDKYKNRLGFGKGYYDRALKTNSKKIGICFEEQIYENRIKVDPFDIRMDKIITDKNIY